ncbi:MAG: hypothetical protein AAFV53_27155 [Myxococcota bacterium]
MSEGSSELIILNGERLWSLATAYISGGYEKTLKGALVMAAKELHKFHNGDTSIIINPGRHPSEAMMRLTGGYQKKKVIEEAFAPVKTDQPFEGDWMWIATPVEL